MVLQGSGQITIELSLYSPVLGLVGYFSFFLKQQQQQLQQQQQRYDMVLLHLSTSTDSQL